MLATEHDEVFELVGDTSRLENHPDFTALSVSGIELSPFRRDIMTPIPGKLDVQRFEVLRLKAELDASVTEPTQWIQQTKKPYGVTFSVPKTSTIRERSPLTPNDLWPADTVGVLYAGFPLYPRSSFEDATVSVYVNTKTTEREVYRDREKFEWINGLKYTEVHCGGGIKYDDCDAYTFQNHMGYRFVFSFHQGQPWALESGCLDVGIDPRQERSFIRLFLSHVFFFKPEVAVGESRPSVNSPRQIERSN